MFAVLVLTPLLFLGLVTFWRCLQIAIDDWEFSVRIMRLRAAYGQLVPELAGVLAQADVDEAEVTMLSGRWQALQKMLSVAGSIAVISSAVLGADVGVIVYGAAGSLPAALLTGAVGGAMLLLATTRYQWARWCKASSNPAVPPVPVKDRRPVPKAAVNRRRGAWTGRERTRGVFHQIGHYTAPSGSPAGAARPDHHLPHPGSTRTVNPVRVARRRGKPG